MKKSLFIFCLVCISSAVLAQPKWGSEWKLFGANYVFDEEMDEGLKLETNFIRDIAVDKNGDIYFASGNRLILYKDKKYNVYKTKSYGSPKYVNSVAINSKGTLYVGTNKGLYTFNGSDFVHVSLPGVSNVAEIAINKDDHVYVSGFSSDAINASGAGLSVYDGTEWKNYNTKNSELPYRFVEDMAFDKDGNVWMSVGLEDRGVVKFDGQTWLFFNSENSGLKSNTVRDIEFDSENNAWFCTPKGVAKYNGQEWYTYGLKDLLYGTMFSQLTKWVDIPDLMSIAIDENDVAWIGTEGEGVIRIQGDGKSQISVDNSPLTSNYIRKIYVDHENRKWFLTGMMAENWGDRFFKDMDEASGSFKGAVMYKDPDYGHYPDWSIMNTFTSDQPGNNFYSLQNTGDGSMWMATAGFGAVEYKEGKWNIYQDPNRGITGEMLNCLTVGPNGECYAGAQMKGLYKKEGNELIQKPKEEFGYKNKNIKDLLVDDEGYLWVAHIAGVDRCKDGKCDQFNKKNGLLSNNVFYLKQDSKGRVLITTTKGVSIYDHGSWSSWDKKANGLLGYVYDVTEDANGTFWAGTGKGLFKLDGDQWKKVEVTGEGIPKYITVQCIDVDANGKLWIGAQTNGLFTYDGNKWQHFNWENSGVIFAKIWDVEIADNGDVWISMEEGGTISSGNSYSAGSTPATAPDPGYEIKQKIKKFDPSASLVIYKGNN
ncbi:MAG: hypothetical protein N4A46_08395 [Schleiferiaceae bacterium]|jgi:ligand-binding sensor domain-containing protein|nr:hypothetical protein [Schleiferiaceae bacterium]